MLDGLDGAGKTSQAELLTGFLRESGIPVEHLRDPGGTAIGERIREILLDPESSAMEPEAETLLYLAARVQLVKERILPALQAGTTIVCERFIYSTVAYQGAHGEISTERIWELWRNILPKLDPDLVLLLDLDPEVGLGRLKGKKDRMESLGLAYHRKVHANFIQMAAWMPDRIESIPADRTLEEVHRQIREVVRGRLLSGSDSRKGG